MKSARKRHILEERYLDFYCRAMAILDNEDDAKDAVQEAVTQTLVRVGVRDMVSYCFRATEHECINILRYRRRLTAYDESTVPLPDSDPRLLAELRESKNMLLPIERKVLELRREHGYTIPETASLVGLSPTTVKRLMAIAVKKLKYNMTHEV